MTIQGYPVPDLPGFDAYLGSLQPLTIYADPTLPWAEVAAIKSAADDLANLKVISRATVASWVQEHPRSANVLGLIVGLSQEKFKNTLKHHLKSSGWIMLSKEHPDDLVRMLDEEFDLIHLLDVQSGLSYDFGDILIARAGTRQTAAAAGASGRKVEDEIEAIAKELGLPYQARTRFTGRNGRTAPCDLVIPSGDHAEIAVAAKGFDSTGSKLSDAVTEIENMADVRQPRQYVLAVIDGIGWKNRLKDLRRIYTLWERRQIDGMYSLASLGSFRDDLREAARLRGLL